jgi:hypothetical protein
VVDISKGDHSRTDGSHPIVFKTPKTNQVPGQSITLNTVEVVVHRTHEQNQTTQTSQDVSSISGKGLRDTQAGLGLDYDVERCAES